MTGVLTSAYDSLSLRVSYLHDVGNEHDSYIITPSIGYGTPLGTKTYAGVGVSADYVGKDYSQTYFGVTPAGAVASGLPAYAVSDSGVKNVRHQIGTPSRRDRGCKSVSITYVAV